MKGRQISAIICTILLFAACSSSVRTAGSEAGRVAITEAPEGYTGEMAASHYYLEGVRLVNIHCDTVTALKAYRKALGFDSLHSPSYFEMARLTAGSDIDKALEYSHKANNIDTASIWYKGQLGQLLIMADRYDEALSVYQKMTELAPNNPDNYYYLAALYNETGKVYTAITLLDSAETRFGVTEWLSPYKRNMLITTGQTERAIEESKILADHFPYDETNYVILGDLYAKTGRDSLAEDAFMHALAIDRHSVEALASMTDFYGQRKRTDEFLSTINQLFDSEKIEAQIKIDFFNSVFRDPVFYKNNYFRVTQLITTLMRRHPQDFGVTSLYAGHFMKSGDAENGLKVIKDYLRDSTYLGAYEVVIYLETQLEHTDSALHYADMALKHFPDRIDLYLQKSSIYYSMNKYREAEKEMGKAMKFAPNDSVRSAMYSSIGDMRFAADSLDTKRIYPLYDKALKLYPDNVNALNNYSYYLSLEGVKLDKALKMTERVMELAPGNPVYIDTYGWVLYKMGRYEEARTALRQAVALDPDANAELFYHYAEVLHELGEYSLALVYFRKALENGYDKETIERRAQETMNKQTK